MNSETISEQIVGMVDHLPPMPANIVELRRIAADPDVNYRHMLPVLEKDPGLCADLLHLANSSYYGVGHSVETVNEAIRYLGVDSLVNYIAVSFSEKAVKQCFSEVRRLSSYFEHSRQISLAAKTLAKHAGLPRRTQDAYGVAGLLHDLGRLLIHVISGDLSYELIARERIDMARQITTENRQFGINHCKIGAMICKKWHFSQALQLTVLRHHTPLLKNDFCNEAAFILLAHLFVDDLPEDMLTCCFPEEITAQMGLTPASVLAAREEYWEAWEEQCA